MELRHLGLPVHDRDRSLPFYSTYFRFDRTSARSYPDGTIIVCDPSGFDLALHPVPKAAAGHGFLHFGFQVADGDTVRRLRRRMESDGVPVVEEDDEPDLVSFKCLDPDGWRVEVYWDRL